MAPNKPYTPQQKIRKLVLAKTIKETPVYHYDFTYFSSGFLCTSILTDFNEMITSVSET